MNPILQRWSGVIKQIKTSGLLAAVLAFALLAACRPTQPGMMPQPTMPVPSPEARQPAPPAPEPSSPDALEACDIDLQSQALRPGHIPDWNNLGISTCYALEFDLTSGGSEFDGSAGITFTNPGQSQLEEIVLRTFPNAPLLFGGSMEITSVRLNGTELTPETFLEDHSAVRLSLPSPLAPGETLHLDLEFTCQLPVDFDRDWIYGTYHYSSDGPVVMLANAYPMLALLEEGSWQASPVLVEGDAVVSPTALYRARVLVPAGWQAVASGREIDREESTAVTTIQFAGGPLRDFMLAASPAFILHEDQWDDIRIQHWGRQVTEGNWDRAVQAAKDSLELFENTFGPLPYNELDIIAAPLVNASGVEYPGLFLLGESLYQSNSLPYLLPAVTAHEVAHQWWYAVVGNDVLEYPWQDEALATYSAQQYTLADNPNTYLGTLENFTFRVETLEAASGRQAVGQSVADFSDNPRDYATVVYHKGYLFLEEVRRQIGEQAFDSALQEYYQTNAYRLAPPDALLNSFEDACLCQLDELYDDWGVSP